MDIEEFVRWWRSKDRTDIEGMLAALAAETETADGEVSWWRASTEVSAALRRTGRVRVGCTAAHRASCAAMAVCTSTGLRDVDRDGATRLARAAGDAARVLVAGDDLPGTETLLRPFFGATSVRAV